MRSFEELGVTPELVEAIAAEGIEIPSAFQESAIPVLLRGNHLLAQAGPGAGTLLAYGIPLLQGVEEGAKGLGGLVLTPTGQGAHRLAESLSRLALTTGHRVAALGSPWALPEQAEILFGTPEEVLRAVATSSLPVDGVRVLVVDGFTSLLPHAREALETLVETLPREGRRIVLGQPLGPEAEAFAKAHMTRAVHIPPRAAGEDGEEPSSTRRGEVEYRVTGEAKEEALLQAVAGALESGAHHLLVFFHSEDQAADMGDLLALHGYLAGAPGETEFPVWLGTRELEARKLLDSWTDQAPVATVSLDVPADPDSLDRRHGGRWGGTVLVRSRELLHLKDLARRAGYRLVPTPEPIPTRVAGELERITGALHRALQEEELAPHYLALEGLFHEFSPAEVAAAAMALLRKQAASGKGTQGDEASQRDTRVSGPAPKTWVRLFFGVGEKEEVGPGDLLGAIAGEAGVEGSQVGKIEIRETFSLVEVVANVADRVVRGVNGTTIRGRSVRVDYDRGGPGPRSGGSSRGGRGPGRGGSGGRGPARSPRENPRTKRDRG